MSSERRDLGEFLFVVLTGLFVGSLVVCNLIANKFVTVDLGFKVFVVSAGSLPYPVTFLVTDVLSEIYGKRRANQVVFAGFAASMLVLAALYLGHLFPAIPDSAVDDATYDEVFKNAWRVIFASMTAYLVAQFADIRMFHFWRRLTNGRHLWLRNNASTVASQLVDSTLVVLVLFGGVWGVEQMASVVFDLWLFKALFALIDTPIAYVLVHHFRQIVPEPGP